MYSPISFFSCGISFIFKSITHAESHGPGTGGVWSKLPLTGKAGTAFIWIVFAAAAVFFPLSAHAGIFSFVTSFFGAPPDEVVGAAFTSQNAPVLTAARSPDPNPAKGGGDITIVGGSALLPEAGPAGTLADIEENHSGTISLYVVREGDTLTAIAKMFGVTVNTVIWANDLRSGLIRPGQILVILPISGVRHTVVRGDTIAGIAKKYKADLGEILQYNNLAEVAELAVGDVILVPDGELAVGTVALSPVRGAGGPHYEGYYLRPILGGRKTQGLHGYNGVDLATYYGAPILASAEGQVIVVRESGWNGGYGKYIVIAHPNGTQTLYAHNSQNIVWVGMRVVRGQIIGYVGSSGRSTGPHIHFEVRGAKNPF